MKQKVKWTDGETGVIANAFVVKRLSDPFSSAIDILEAAQRDALPAERRRVIPTLQMKVVPQLRTEIVRQWKERTDATERDPVVVQVEVEKPVTWAALQAALDTPTLAALLV